MPTIIKAYFELDLTDHATLAALSSCQLLPNGQHISQLIPRDLYMRLRLHLDYVRRAIASWITDDQGQTDGTFTTRNSRKILTTCSCMNDEHENETTRPAF